jgi:hypothetical protein
MNSVLRYLIFAGFVIWGFFLFAEYMPVEMPSFRVDDANKTDRCQAYRETEEDAGTLQYGDRLKQLVSGCL